MDQKKSQLVFDPPEGWKYGFPKLIPSGYLGNESLMRIWLQSNGYPSDKIDFALKHYRIWKSRKENES